MKLNERPRGPAEVYEHDHPPVRNVNEEYERRMTVGQRIADSVAATVGSWPFIITQSILLGGWLAVNAYLAIAIKVHPGMFKAWDPYPFILLNLVLSFQAAYTGPVVVMSQNRQSQKDRLAAEHDYEVNKRAEQEIEVVMKHLVHQDKLILESIKRLEELKGAIPEQQSAEEMRDILARMEENDRRVVALMERIEAAARGAG